MFKSDRYCTVEESLTESLKQMKLTREGKQPKKLWKDFLAELREENERKVIDMRDIVELISEEVASLRHNTTDDVIYTITAFRPCMDKEHIIYNVTEFTEYKYEYTYNLDSFKFKSKPLKPIVLAVFSDKVELTDYINDSRRLNEEDKKYLIRRITDFSEDYLDTALDFLKSGREKYKDLEVLAKLEYDKNCDLNKCIKLVITKELEDTIIPLLLESANYCKGFNYWAEQYINLVNKAPYGTYKMNAEILIDKLDIIITRINDRIDKDRLQYPLETEIEILDLLKLVKDMLIEVEINNFK